MKRLKKIEVKPTPCLCFTVPFSARAKVLSAGIHFDSKLSVADAFPTPVFSILNVSATRKRLHKHVQTYTGTTAYSSLALALAFAGSLALIDEGMPGLEVYLLPDACTNRLPG